MISGILILGCLGILYAYYLEKSIFRPFHKLKNFALRVALGDLELPLAMDKGNRFGAFTESFDLMREELKKSRASERAANQSKKELVASLSHDIKTPVASIKAVAEVLQVKTKEENMKKQLNIITTKADQINSLITNMFTATLEELQELKVNVTEQSSIFLYDLIHNADYNHQVTILKKAECIIFANELRLAQVIDNIISNSYKYAGTDIEVSFQINGSFLEISFQDYGPGVSKEEELLIFHKFYRARNASNKSGAGLGLYISKYLIEKMSGEIEGEKLAEGFVIRLKLRIV
jgi:signal transduction histidine kinase